MPVRLPERPFTLPLFLAAGGTRDELRGLVRSGAVRRVVRGVYAAASLPEDLQLRLRTASLVLPPGGVLARRGAAWVYGVDAHPPGTQHDPLRLEAAVPEGVEPVRTLGLRCFTEHLAAWDVQELDGVPVTTPGRTAVDLARWLPRGDALAALDALAHQGSLDADELDRELPRWAGYAFVRQARELAALADPRSESWGESVTRLRLHDAGFPAPTSQIVVSVAGRRFRLDLGWEELRKALEYDGAAWHERQDQVRRDEARRALLRSAGWEVAVVTREHVLGRGRHFEELVCRLTGYMPVSVAA